MVGYGSNRLIRVGHLVGITLPKKNGFSDILKDSIIRSNEFNSFLLLCLVWYFAWIPIKKKKKKKLNCAIYRKWIVLYAFDW